MCKKNYATKLCAAMTAMSIVLSGCAQSTGTDVNDNSSSENQITEEVTNYKQSIVFGRKIMIKKG